MRIRGDELMRCPFDRAFRRAAQGHVSSRDIATAMNCSLLSDCTARCGCLEKVFLLLNDAGARPYLDAAE